MSEFSRSVERISWLLLDQLRRENTRAVLFCGVQSTADSPLLTFRVAAELKKSYGLNPLAVRIRIDPNERIGPLPPAVASETIDWFSEGKNGAGAPLGVRVCALLAEASSRHDFVLVEAPPVLNSVTCLNLISVVPHVVLIAEFGRTQQPSLRRAIKELTNAGATITGTILSGRRQIIPRWIERWLGTT